MNNRYLVIDVETPNRKNDRISAIAVVCITDGAIQESKYFLVNPEVDFDDFNVSLTGISPMDVVSAPTFPEVWGQIRGDFASSTIVAHNAPFDLCVLEKTCQAYDIPFDPPTYIDTVRMAKAALPELVRHRLNDVCEALSLELEHHRADSDCAACAEIFLHCVRSDVEPEDFERVFRGGECRSSGTVKERTIHSKFGFDIRIAAGGPGPAPKREPRPAKPIKQSKQKPKQTTETESALFLELLPLFTAVANRNFLPPTGISLLPGGDYSSVFAYGLLICRICWRRKKYIAVKGTPEQYPDISALEYEQKKNSEGFLNLLLHNPGDVSALLPILEQAMQDAVDLIPKDYDCCSRFEQCSAARACIHPDKEFAKGCGYRKKLAHGIVFGAND